MGRSGYDITGSWTDEDPETPYSICSADSPNLEEEHPLIQLKDSFLQAIMAAYMQQVGGRKQDENDQTIDNREIYLGPAEHEGDGEDRPRKRGRPSEDKQSQKSITRRRAQDRKLWLACPFAKKDPIKYRDCYRYFLGRVRDVKQHLTRCHRKPLYCPTCNETFEDEDDRDSHIRSQSCTERSDIVIEGISEKQKRELGQRISSKMGEEQQWFAVYDILFHPHPRPRTPYRDRELSEELCRFQDFMTARGPTILTEVIEARGMDLANLPQEERSLASFMRERLGEGLQHIIDQWANDNASASSTAIGQSSVDHSRRSSLTLDSGIAMPVDHLQTVEEKGKKNSSSTNNEIEQRHALEAFMQSKGPWLRFGAEDGIEQGPSQSVMDGAAIPSDGLLSETSRSDIVESAGPPSTLQPTVLPEYSEPIDFSVTAETLNLIDFDIEWPA